jgi:hypothetical protein
VGEDERCEGDSKLENAGGWVGLTMGEGDGDGDGGGQKCIGALVILASEADGPSQGWTGEVATCSGTRQRSGAER